MEHRWGQRFGVDLPVRVAVQPFSVQTGRLTDLSVSGGFIRLDCDVRVLSRVQVTIEHGHPSRHQAPVIAAYVARRLKDGIGVEWCEFAPEEVARLLQSLTARRHNHLHKIENPAAIAIARLSSPLLRHGT